MNPDNDPWGEPLHRYTRAEAIADGVLVDVTQEATAGMLGGFAVPVAITAALHEAIAAIPPALEGLADMRGRLHDVLWMANLALRRQGAKLGLSCGNLAPSMFERFQVVLPVRGTRKRVQTLCLAVDGGDDGRPCVTLGFPEDF